MALAYGERFTFRCGLRYHTYTSIILAFAFEVFMETYTLADLESLLDSFTGLYFFSGFIAGLLVCSVIVVLAALFLNR